ncbi:MAG: glutamate--tRNA ligase [Firmicutes bacterium]|nr:glutamate--tRNA ligase [Bacillota bacterium]
MIRTRFAPSPTGFMHLGNLRTALYCYLFAKNGGGKFILRIEDTDREREVKGAVDIIYATLERCGMVLDESPKNPGKVAPYVQSERLDIYLKHAKELVKLKGAYYCFCDKERLESLKDENGIRKYDKHCLSLSEEEVNKRIKTESFVIRQNVPETGVSSYTDLVYGNVAVECKELEDNILIKSDGYPTYNFANVVDDYLMGITHVFRGCEYLSSTPKYNLIYRAFGWKEPNYIHLPLIMRDHSHKLSKRHGDANFEDFYEKGYLPEAIINYIALLGWSPKNNAEKMSLPELIASFSISGINKSQSIFDADKLKWLNSLYIKELSQENFLTLATPYFDKCGLKGRFNYALLASLLQTRVDFLGEIPEKVNFINDFEGYSLDLFNHEKMKTNASVAKALLPHACEALKNLNDFTHQSISEALTKKSEELNVKKGQILWCVRIAITGKESTPGGATEMAELFGKEECVRRIKYSINKIN